MRFVNGALNRESLDFSASCWCPVAYLGGRLCDRPALAWSVPQGVIGNYADCAMAGVLTWVCREESEKKGKVTKKGRQNFFDGNFLEIGLRPKNRSLNILAAPISISKYATVGVHRVPVM
jgi:hypothetical protein